MICYYFAILLLAYHANAEIAKKTILKELQEASRYLRAVGDLDRNATIKIMLADAQLSYLLKSTPNLSDEDKSNINSERVKLARLINEYKESYPDEYASKNLLESKDWLADGNFKFKKNLVSGPASTKSAGEIYGRSDDPDIECKKELFGNTRSDEKQSCGISEKCMEKMKNIKDEGPVSPVARAVFLTSLRYFKCTENPQNARNIIMRLCDIIYKDVLKLTDEGYIDNKGHIYMRKVLICGASGFAEFLDDKIIKLLYIQQNPNGSVGKQDLKAKKVLTAQYLAIMAAAYRLKAAGTV